MKKIFYLLVLCSFILPNSLFSQEKDEYPRASFQFTFLFPPLSTNGIQCGNTVNKTSINLLIGYAAGVEGFEAGSLINIDKAFVKGGQFAGFANINGGYMEGAQFAGFANFNRGFGNGAQLAGFLNLNAETMNGTQAAGFMNIAGMEMNGLQLAGFGNIARGYNKGMQGSGFINVAGNGKINVQLAGFANIARDVDGVQIGGFINKAKDVKGVQIAGFINICNSINGIPIGFINIVKEDAYRKIEFSSSEALYWNLSYKMGVRHFYNIYTVGKPAGSLKRWFYGFGIGTEKDLSEKVTVNIEGIVHQEIWLNKHANDFGYHDKLFLLNQVKGIFGFKLSDFVSFFAGPTLNVQVRHCNKDGDYNGSDLAPAWSFFERKCNNKHKTNIKGWIGFNAGIRLL